MSERSLGERIAEATGMTPIGVGNAVRLMQLGWADDRIVAQDFTGNTTLAIQMIREAQSAGA